MTLFYGTVCHLNKTEGGGIGTLTALSSLTALSYNHRSRYDTSSVHLWILLNAEKRSLQRSVLDQPARFTDRQTQNILCVVA